jgi:hypothetical protein
MLATPDAPNFEEILKSYEAELALEDPVDADEDTTLFEEKAERVISVPFMGGTGNKVTTEFGSGTADDWDDWED